MAKEEWRRRLKKERAQISAQRRSEWDLGIARHLQGWAPYLASEKVLIYLAFGWEIDTWMLVDDLEHRGCEIYVPVVEKDSRTLVPTLYTSRRDLSPAVFGILEPHRDAPTVDARALDLIVVPGLAFTRAGYRIGYGGGYYDKLLASASVASVGLCYTAFLRDLPRDPWDRPVDFIATEDGLLGRK